MNVEFQEEQTYQKTFTSPTHRSPAIFSFLVRYSGGLIKSEKQASIVLTTLCVLGIVASIYIFQQSKPPQAPAPVIHGQ